MQRGLATFTLDTGTCPRWLFERMVRLGRSMVHIMVDEYGPEEVVRRLGDPVWFQALGTVLAFDWNASGLTTILTAALKEAIRGDETALGLFVCGGKGKTSRKTPEQIQQWSRVLQLAPEAGDRLEYNSRMSAKVDSALVQDGYQLYHHAFIFASGGAWTVIQQGMNQSNRTARRYHWHSADAHDLVVEPHTGIASQGQPGSVLNLTAAEGENNRQLSVELLQAEASSLRRDLELLDRHQSELSRMVRGRVRDEQLTILELEAVEFRHHPVEREFFANSRYLHKILNKISDNSIENYEKLVSQPGVGPKTVRALSLVAEVLYGAKASYRDPARYSYAHGGKDATPYPVDTATYDQTINALQRLAAKAKRQMTTSHA